MSVCEHGIDTRATQCHKCNPLGSLGVSQLNRMLEIKQDDWLEVCKENDRLTAEVEKWEELCGAMLVFVLEGAGERRAERFEQEYEALRSE